MIRMVRKTVRAIVAGSCLASLLASIGAGWLWWRSYRTTDNLSHVVDGERYTAASAGGRVTVVGPPARSSSPAIAAAAAADAAQLRNDQVVWPVLPENDASGVSVDYVYLPLPRPGIAAARLEQQYRPADTVRPLLNALADPDRFAAAHMLLLRYWPAWRRPSDTSLTHRPGADCGDGNWTVLYAEFLDTNGQALWARVDHCGLAVDLRLPPADDAPHFSGAWGFEFVGRPDPAQLPAVRNQWHRRLDVPPASVHHWQAVAATTLPPLLWLGAAARRTWVGRRRRRLGLCRRCAYDLRGIPPGVCPECGGGRAAGMGAA